MPAFSYEEVHAAAPESSRQREREAFDHALGLLERAAADPNASQKRREAARAIQDLWGFLIKDLTNPANDLSDDLKANLISIGLWTIREADKVIAGHADTVTAIIEINRTVREGLST